MKIGVLTTFTGADEAYSLVNVVKTQLEMLMGGGYSPILFVSDVFREQGFWSSTNFEIRHVLTPDAKYHDIVHALEQKAMDIDVMICHDIVFLEQHAEWGKAVRIMSRRYPHISWLHWQHSRGDHVVEEAPSNSWYCYPNQGDLEHVAAMNKTTSDKVVYVPHPMDFSYLGWPELAIRIAEDFQYPFADVSGVLPTRLDFQKQVEKAVRIYAGLKRIGKSVCFLCADAFATGERFKEYKKFVLDIAKEQGLTDKEFAFLGEVYGECMYSTPRAVVKALYEMGNLFILPSNSETSSLVAMEAAIAGNLLVINEDFFPIHHLYKKALAMPFGSVYKDTLYYRDFVTADGERTRVEDPQMFWDDKARMVILPALNTQLVLSVKRQQFRERWPSRVFKDHLEPLLKMVYRPRAVVVTGGTNSPVEIPVQEPEKQEESNKEDESQECAGDVSPPTVSRFHDDVTYIITTFDNLPMLKRQIPILLEEVGNIIVVDQECKDGTKEWLDSLDDPRVRVIHRINEGAGKGRNSGIDMWNNSTPFLGFLDGGILPISGGVTAMRNYLDRHPEVHSVSPEIQTCYVTEEGAAHKRMMEIDDSRTFHQKMLSGTAFSLTRASAWDGIRWNEEGPFGEKGWGVDDNDMAFRWLKHGIIHHDFNGVSIYRRASGSFNRLYEETGIWPNQYGSVYEARHVLMTQTYPEYYDPIWRKTVFKISCVIVAWNEYPMVARVCKALHDELQDIPHEIILVDNGSTDDTKWWLDTHALRWYWGDVAIDARTHEIIRRSEDNESTWTGHIVRIDLPENMGIGYGSNRGFEKAKGEYIFHIDGDCLPVKGNIVQMYNYMVEHPEIDFLAVNALVSQKDTEDVELVDYNTIVAQGLGNYAYAYSLMKRKVWDEGCRFPENGPFAGPGAGYEDADFANQMYAKKYLCKMFNAPYYFHDRRDGKRSGVPDSQFFEKSRERKRWLTVKWNEARFDMTHYHDGPPDRHIRRVAVMSNITEYHFGPSAGLADALRRIGCEVDEFDSLTEPEVKNYDNYLFVDDGNWKHFDCPEWAHPSAYWALDMYYPSGWPYGSPDDYIRVGKTFDKFYTSTQGAADYAIQNGLNAEVLHFAGDEELHKPYPDLERCWDWVALWHNCGNRIEYANAAQARFPLGFIGYCEMDGYAQYMNHARCVINLCRIDEYNMRVPEAMLSGVPLVTDRTKGLKEFFVEDEHYLGHSSIDEMLEKIQWVKDHPEEAQIMADKARSVALSGHTYYHRVLQMFGRLV